MGIRSLNDKDDMLVQKPDGTRLGPFKTNFATNEIRIYDEALDADVGDFIVQLLPGGKEKLHVVRDINHSKGLRSISPHWILVTQSLSEQERQQAMSGPTYNFSNSNVQIGNHNVQNIVASMESLVTEINNAAVEPAEKEKAKGILRSLIENPVVASVLGAGVQTIGAALLL